MSMHVHEKIKKLDYICVSLWASRNPDYVNRSFSLLFKEENVKIERERFVRSINETFLIPKKRILVYI